MNRTVIAALIVVFSATSVGAQTIERACLQADRSAANRALCGCIQEAANMSLSGGDQKIAAGFFKDPQKAQDMRQSDRRSHEIFWKRYKQFGDMARTFCASDS